MSPKALKLRSFSQIHAMAGTGRKGISDALRRGIRYTTASAFCVRLISVSRIRTFCSFPVVVTGKSLMNRIGHGTLLSDPVFGKSHGPEQTGNRRFDRAH